MRVTLKADFSKAIAKLEALQQAMPLGIARGLNAGGDKVRTQVQRALKTQTSLLRYSSVTERVQTSRAYAEGLAKSGIGPSRLRKLAYTIIVLPKKTRLSEFRVRVTRGPHGGVTAWVWGVPHQFARSFQVPGDGKMAGLLKHRADASRYPLEGFNGPNLAKEAVKDDAAEAFERGASTLVLPIIEMQIARLLK